MQVEASFHTSVHVLLRGSCWLTIEDGNPIFLGPGDVMLIGTGVCHTLSGDLSTVALPYEQVLAEMPTRLAKLSTEEANLTSEILCAKYRFDHRAELKGCTKKSEIPKRCLRRSLVLSD